MKKRSCTVIVGAGRLGGTLAGRLSQRGLDVIVVDRSEAALAALPAEFSGIRVRGNATEMQTLRRAKLDEAHRLLAVTDRDDLNLFVALAARHLFGVPNVRVRVSDSVRQSLFEGLEIDTVNPNVLAADEFATGVES